MNELMSDLEFEFSMKPSDMEDLSHLLVEFNGKALIWDDETGGEKEIARLKGHRLDLASARKCYENLQDLFDLITPEISDLGSHIISDNNCYV